MLHLDLLGISIIRHMVQRVAPVEEGIPKDPLQCSLVVERGLFVKREFLLRLGDNDIG